MANVEFTYPRNSRVFYLQGDGICLTNSTSQVLKPKNKLTKKEQLLLLVLAAINFSHIMDFMILMPLAPQLSLLISTGAPLLGLNETRLSQN